MGVLLLPYVALLKGPGPQCLIHHRSVSGCDPIVGYIYMSLEFMRTSVFEKTVEGKGTLTAA